MNNPVAYVLAGGRSSRFGTDKARATLGEFTLLERVATVLQRDARPVVVADLPGKYEDLGFETITDRRPGLGPLGGVEALLLDRLDRLGPGWAVVASCDMVGLKHGWIDEIASCALSTHDIDAVAYRGAYWQPFPGAYHTRMLPAVSGLLDRDRASFQQLLSDECVRTIGLPVPTDWPALVQINTMQDLETFAHAASYEVAEEI